MGILNDIKLQKEKELEILNHYYFFFKSFEKGKTLNGLAALILMDEIDEFIHICPSIEGNQLKISLIVDFFSIHDETQTIQSGLKRDEYPFIDTFFYTDLAVWNLWYLSKT